MSLQKACKVAYQEALKAYKKDEVPIGACIMYKNQVLSKGHNKVHQEKQAIAHAEIQVIQDACLKLNNERLSDCILFTTLEPCTLCTGAIILSRIKKVYFLAYENKYSSLTNLVASQQYNHQVEWEHCKELEKELNYTLLLQNFFKKKRELKKRKF